MIERGRNEEKRGERIKEKETP
jgi:hypothetical protein